MYQYDVVVFVITQSIHVLYEIFFIEISELTISEVSNSDSNRKLEVKLREQLEEVIKLNEKLQKKQVQIEALQMEMAKEIQEKDQLIRERKSLLEERENIGGLMKEAEERNRRAETEKSLLHLQQENKQKQYIVTSLTHDLFYRTTVRKKSLLIFVPIILNCLILYSC